MADGFRRFCWTGLLLLSGCAGMGTADCADAFALGQNHGMLAADQSERLAAQCGGSFDAARYADGFRDGLSRRARVFSL